MKIEVLTPPRQVEIAIDLIETIKKKNKFTYDIYLKLDYQMDDAGLFSCEKPNYITINPWVCEAKCEDKYKGEEGFSFTYIQDDTIFGTIIHEFCHFLSLAYFIDFQTAYLETFPEKRFIITDYEAANEDYDEEIAEIMSLYIRNPYLLKLISKDHYNFMKSWFISPIPCTVRRFIFTYNKMPIGIKNKLLTKWGIVVNHAEKRVYVSKEHAHDIGIIQKP